MLIDKGENRAIYSELKRLNADIKTIKAANLTHSQLLFLLDFLKKHNKKQIWCNIWNYLLRMVSQHGKTWHKQLQFSMLSDHVVWLHSRQVLFTLLARLYRFTRKTGSRNIFLCWALLLFHICASLPKQSPQYCTWEDVNDFPHVHNPQNGCCKVTIILLVSWGYRHIRPPRDLFFLVTF